MSCLKTFCVLTAYVVLFLSGFGRGSDIFGGEEVEPHTLRFMAFIEPACGGILIDPQWVLTAAHCDHRQRVLLGVHNIRNEERESRQPRIVAETVRHPHFDRVRRVNDLMLLKLKKPVQETSAVECLRLGRAIEDPVPGTSCLVAGWGETTVFELSDVLRSATVAVIDRRTCNILYRRDAVIGRSLICAGSFSNGMISADTCGGDSGGPLLCNGGLVGVTSFGGTCGYTRKPGVYSFLTKHQLDWIHNTTISTDL